MNDDSELWECPSAQCTWTTRNMPDLAPHINEEHPGEFKRNDWLSFLNPESVQYKGQQRRRRGLAEQKTDSDEE